jgi:pyruvate carboxylase
LIKSILKTQKKADRLDIDFDQAQQKALQLRPHGSPLLDGLSYCLYPKIFEQFVKHEAKYGCVQNLPVDVFLHGM